MIGQADTTPGHGLGPLLVKHRLIKLALLAIEQPTGRYRIAHTLEHHLQKQRLELLGGAAQACRLIGAGGVLEPLQALYIEGELATHVLDAHQIISSSARSEPAALSASRIDIKSLGVAPSKLSASTTSTRSAPSTTRR